MTSSEYQ